MECFKKVVTTIITLISIDIAIEEWKELKYARLNIRL